MALHESEDDSGSESLRQIPDDILTVDDAQSPFVGQSPAPFTAPSSPTSSQRNTSIPNGANGHMDDPGMQYLAAALGQPISRSHAATEPSSTATASKIRYLQNDEDELRQRLDALVFRHGLDHPAAIDTHLRLGTVFVKQGRYKAAEIAFTQVIDNARKVLGVAHPTTIRGTSLGGATTIALIGLRDSILRNCEHFRILRTELSCLEIICISLSRRLLHIHRLGASSGVLQGLE